MFQELDVEDQDSTGFGSSETCKHQEQSEREVIGDDYAT